MDRKLKITAAASITCAAALIARIGFIMNDGGITQAAARRGSYTLKSAATGGNIYDRNMQNLVNRAVKYEAVLNPNDKSVVKAFPFIADYDKYYDGIKGSLPFLCEVTSAEPEKEGITVFESVNRYSESQPAPHIVGYLSDSAGVSGIEKAFDGLLRGNAAANTAKFSVDAAGGVLSGLEINIERADKIRFGVVTTLDADIQILAESALKNSGCKKGAAVVMDIESGDILACVSHPDFNALNVRDYLESEDANFVNRAFSAYSVGSVFKLVTAAAALEIGISPEYTHTCGGYSDIGGVTFNCHKWGGHGELDMSEAIVESCNTYFIELSEFIDRNVFVETAAALGFGEAVYLCEGMVSGSGYLQTPRDISIPAERANMSFGQGRLAAAPLQVCRMTAAIAGGGVLPYPKLIKGTVDADGVFTEHEYPNSEPVRALSEDTAKLLRGFMEKTVSAGNSLSRPYLTTAAGKTSTAQTGYIKDDGTEFMNCWFTGYFPAENPRYAVTVLIEDGWSGNTSAAPVFREIADGTVNLGLTFDGV